MPKARIVRRDRYEGARFKVEAEILNDAGTAVLDPEVVKIAINATDFAAQVWAEKEARDAGVAGWQSLAPGTLIPLLAPPAPQAQTAKAVWQAKARRLAALQAMGTITAGPLLDAITALRTDVQSSYAAGYLDDF